MSYIIFVQPTVLAIAGMDFSSVLVATCLSSAIGSVYMGLIAKYPFALAPGMGANFLFAFTVCVDQGFSWQAALTIVFFSGILFLLLSVFRTREKVLEIFPDCLKFALGPAIGLFIAFIGLQWSGIVVLSPATMVTVGNFRHGVPLLSLFGVLLIVALMARNLGGAILVGIFVTTLLGVLTGVIPLKAPEVTLRLDTFAQFNISELLQRWDEALIAIGLFFFLALFDTVGTLVGVSTLAGFMTPDNKLPRAGRAFFSDALATCTGALLGTSTVTAYVESATGVAAGARTGFASLVTAACFLLAIALAPVAAVVGQDIGPEYYQSLGIEGSFVRMYPAVAPALIVVGFLMLAPLRKVNWEDITEGIPAFFTLGIMAFGFGITEGIAAGCIAFAAVKTCAGRWREVHPWMYAVALAFAARYAILK
ncbi:MAG: NCS2 family permease [Candidatus Hydrogenedentes bacterium]|nr:NCS2 family permease [Candidatus Hydrogenedentota bacterium]